ncbi:MAG: MerR family transcriptional regulator [Streptosporangiales bacterium]|nr:MerR family transcriptional regulator [Streptosporangiales bacterium]
MGLLTIGAFARASRLSPKALRLYDELGLLPPAHVDPVSGYRFYDPAQLERARLVAWLRRLGMPLARIRVVCELEPAAAADEVAAYWTQVEADTATRRHLATFLIDHLSGRGTPMSDAQRTLGIRYAARSDIGLVRESNEDSAYAGARLLAVADGFGAHGGGDLASAAAINALKPLDAEVPPGDLLNALENAAHQTNEALHSIVESDPSLEGMGTTLTAMLWSGSQLALVHIGDSRAYLLRGGELFQITHDHTYVQSLVKEGRISLDEAASHPQRSLLLRALDGGDIDPDLQLRAAQAGDRYLLCSDGLSAVVATEAVHDAMRTTSDPERVVRELIDLANQGGGPDNIACVVADVVEL